MDDAGRAVFSDFVAQHWTALVRAAALLGCAPAEAEDLAQTTLVRCFVKWRHVSCAADQRAYAVRVLVNLHRQSRRRSWWREVPTESLPDSGTECAAERSNTAEVVGAALGRLGRQQREVVVLRVYLQFSERETADLLGVPPGTVKSRLSRALRRLADDDNLREWQHG